MKNIIGNKLNVCSTEIILHHLTFFVLSGPLVTDMSSMFTVTPPSSSNMHDTQPSNSFICESASRILFQSIDWIKSNSCFQTLE